MKAADKNKPIITSNYQDAATSYAMRGITGTDAIAFRALAERITSLKLSGVALDLGCGAGRSTRFLKALGLQPVGLEVSEAMVTEARRLDPTGEYFTYRAHKALPFAHASFDVLLSTWVVLEIGSRSNLDTFFSQAARVLRHGGKGFIVTNTAAFYHHKWVSCDVDFPENQGPLQSGQRVKARLMPENVVVTDTFWSDEVYREALGHGGLTVIHAWHPLAPASETAWLDETRIAPWVIYEVDKAS